MAHDYSTITLRAEVKDRLAIHKGERSWDEFLSGVADQLPVDEAIEEMERRLAELREQKARSVPWAAVKAKRRKAELSSRKPAAPKRASGGRRKTRRK